MELEVKRLREEKSNNEAHIKKIKQEMEGENELLQHQEVSNLFDHILHSISQSIQELEPQSVSHHSFFFFCLLIQIADRNIQLY